MGRRLWELSKVRETSERLLGTRLAAPLKMTSVRTLERRDLADISPRHQRRASTTLDLPQPLGPTMAVIPGSNSRRVRSAKDLKPTISRRFKYIFYHPFASAYSLLPTTNGHILPKPGGLSRAHPRRPPGRPAPGGIPPPVRRCTRRRQRRTRSGPAFRSGRR